MSAVYTFLAPGLEEVECLAVVDVLRRGGIRVVMVSVGDTLEVEGSHGIRILADCCFGEISCEEADVLFLPGGMPGTRHLSECKELCKELLSHHQKGKTLAAICAAPSVLGQLGILQGKRATCYPGFEDQLSGAIYSRQGIVTDGNIVTARGLGYALDLGFELISILIDRDTANQIKAGIQYDQF